MFPEYFGTLICLNEFFGAITLRSHTDLHKLEYRSTMTTIFVLISINNLTMISVEAGR